MHLLSSLSLSALLLAASVPAFAAESAAVAAALPAADAPALQVSAPPAAAASPTAGTVSPSLTGATALGGLADAQTLALLEQLRALDVTPQQAMGGVGAMLGLAQSQLAGDQYAQLAGAVPGLQLLGGAAALGALGPLGALGGLLGNAEPQEPAQEAPVDSLDGLNQRFSALGMAPGLVGQFAPILLQFLGNQGVASALLQSLAGVWGVPGALAPAPATQPVAVGG